MPSGDDWRPTARWETLQRRAALLRALRGLFDQWGFVEVETPVLSADVVVDRHLDPLCTTLFTDPRQPQSGPRRWLQTSPEFHMKRLLAAGAGPIYQVSRVFRGGECGRLHNPEFTLVEWYRPGETLWEGMHRLSELAAALLHRGPAEIVSYRQAFLRQAGVDPHTADLDQLRQAAAPRLPDLDIAGWTDRDALLDALLTETVQPHLGRGRPTILWGFPVSQAALARVQVHDGQPVAERFELFLEGIELANGYHELLDPGELRRRTAANNALRQADGKPPLPEENRLLAAMEHGLPPCTGAALGFDRLVMVAVGAASLAEVLAFPSDRA